MKKNGIRLYITEEMRERITSAGGSVSGYVVASITRAKNLEFLSMSAYNSFITRPKVKFMMVTIDDWVYKLIKKSVWLGDSSADVEIKVGKSKYVNICVYHYLLEGVSE